MLDAVEIFDARRVQAHNADQGFIHFISVSGADRSDLENRPQRNAAVREKSDRKLRQISEEKHFRPITAYCAGRLKLKSVQIREIYDFNFKLE